MVTAGQIVIGNTGQAGIRSDGTTALFNATPDCPECCGDKCGECAAAISGDVTVDLGATSWTGNDENYYDSCETPCRDLTGEVVLNQGNIHTETSEDGYCGWYLIFNPFCTYDSTPLDGSYNFYKLTLELKFIYVSGTWKWRLEIICYLNIHPGVPWYLYIVRRVYYEAATTTTCSGSHTLTKTNDEYFDVPFAGRIIPCFSSDPDWAFPATVDIDVP